jgi:hypothetical protein
MGMRARRGARAPSTHTLTLRQRGAVARTKPDQNVTARPLASLWASRRLQLSNVTTRTPSAGSRAVRGVRVREGGRTPGLARDRDPDAVAGGDERRVLLAAELAHGLRRGVPAATDEDERADAQVAAIRVRAGGQREHGDGGEPGRHRATVVDRLGESTGRFGNACGVLPESGSAARKTMWLLAGALALGGCGSGLDGSATSAERAKVERYLRNVRDVACEHPQGMTRCEVRVRKRPVGLEAWTCEFVFRRGGSADAPAYSGADACWTDGGSADNLRREVGA